MSAEPAAAPAVSAAASTAPRPARAHLRVALLAAGGALAFAAVLFIAGELAAARVPEQRAALEELIRRETGLEVSFRALSVRWGWYGPEAVFHDVVLGEPAGGGALLRAPRLSIAFDAWRMVRSGHLEAGRITLERPDIDLRSAAAAPAGSPAREAAARTDLFAAGAHVLSRWRGGRIDIEGGTLRGLPPHGVPAVELALRHVQLRRLGDDWDADALVLLPESLGSSAHLTLAMRGDPARPQGTHGTLNIDGRRLEFAGWRALAAERPLARYLPQAGSGNLELEVAFSGAQLLEAHGRIHAQGIEWQAPAAAAAPLALERLRGGWELERRGGEWRLTADALDTGGSAREPATLRVVAAADGSYAHGEILNAAIPLLARLGRWYAPQLPLAPVSLEGRARELTFDWSAARPSGARLITAADLEDLTLASPAYGVHLNGLSGHVSGSDERFVADLGAQSAHLTLARAQPLDLDALEIAARLALDATGGGWQLSTEDLEVRHGAQSLAASGVIVASGVDAAPHLRAHLAVKDADVTLVREVLSSSTLAALGSAAAHLTAGRVASADLAWRGALDGTARWSAPGTDFTGAVVLREASLRGDELWPDTDGIAARIDWRGSRVRIATEVGSVALRGLAGLPPIEALHGTLTSAGAHLGRSTLAGQWLGGPVSLAVSERRDRRGVQLAISGRGLIDARRAVEAAGGDADAAQLAGTAEWSALLTYLPAVDAQHARWRLRADSSLTGVASRLPEPFTKAAGAALPLHLELQGADDDAQLRIGVGERLAALAALARSGEVWRIERGAVRLGGAGTAPALPAEPVILVDGRLSRLDLGACLAWWREAGRDPALPELRARLFAAELLTGTRSYPEASLSARVTRGGGALALDSGGLSGTARWPALSDGAHPAAVELKSFNIAQPDDVTRAGALAGLLAPATTLTIADLQWQGRSLGRLSAALAARGDGLDLNELHLNGASGDTHGSARCAAGACRASFSLESADAAATLAAFGLRPDLSAEHARLAGELAWSPEVPAPLATLGGHLHMQLGPGVVRPAPEADGVPFALLSVPALIAGMSGEAAIGPGLEFTGLTANYELKDGEASTTDLHFDGDAEILLRGRVGLLARDYDEQAWILKGEQRLPEAVRRLGPTPKVAAVWLSLRDLFAGGGTERTRAALRLRGHWNDPIVTPAE